MANEKKTAVIGLAVDVPTLVKQLKSLEGEEAKNALIVIDYQGDQIEVLTKDLAEAQTAYLKLEGVAKVGIENLQKELAELQEKYEALEEELESKDEALEEYKELVKDANEKLKSIPQAAIAEDSFEVDGKTYKLLYPSFQHEGEVIDISVLKQNARIAQEVIAYGTLTKQV